MKNMFHGYFRPSAKDFKELWENSLFAFDANILLHLYRYSDSTRVELLKVMHTLESKIWLPKQAAEEYFRNRLITTESQIKQYSECLIAVEKNLELLQNKKRHPFISDKLLNNFEKLVRQLKREFSVNEQALKQRINDDEILEEIANLFDGKVGIGFTEEKLLKIYKEGESRYKNKIPPGYKDIGKDKIEDQYRKYGDLVIWEELMKKAKDEGKSLIFITDDQKKDWWLTSESKTIGPLPELIQEFKKRTHQNFYMYTADRFMNAVNDYSTENIQSDTINELREVRINESENQLKKLDLTESIDKILESFEAIRKAEIFFKMNADTNKLFMNNKLFMYNGLLANSLLPENPDKNNYQEVSK